MDNIKIDDKLDQFAAAVCLYTFDMVNISKMEKELSDQFGTDVTCCPTDNLGVRVKAVIDGHPMAVDLKLNLSVA